MAAEDKTFLEVTTPLNVEVRTTARYWEYLTTIKHPAMKEKENIVKAVLQSPDEIRQSRTDKEVFLYYKKLDRLYCVVVKRIGAQGFLITAYPTDKMKEGDIIWTG